MACFALLVMIQILLTPASIISCTIVSRAGLFISCNISLGIAFVIGRKREPIPPAGIITFVTVYSALLLIVLIEEIENKKQETKSKV